MPWLLHPGLVAPVLAIMGAAFLLGVVHGITPDEHTWPITFSYAIGSYSSRRGFLTGLIFSAAFTVQRAIASELASVSLGRLLLSINDSVVYVVVGMAMFLAGAYLLRSGRVFHLHFRSRASHGFQDGNSQAATATLRPWMAAVHGFIAGWGVGAFAIVLYTVLAPAMPSHWWGWVPGACFGLGTTVIQALAGALFGRLAQRRGLDAAAIQRVALKTAGRTLYWGGGCFAAAGAVGLLWPKAASWQIATGIRIPNLDGIGIPLILVILTVGVIGVGNLVRETRRETPRELSRLTS